VNEFSTGSSSPKPKSKLTGLLPLGFLAVAGLAFWGGIVVQKDFLTKAVTALTASVQSSGTAGAAGGGSGRRFGGRPTLGTVSSLSGSTLVVKTSSADVTVDLTSSTMITNGGSAASVSDIATGDTVAVIGTAASDGTVTATRVLLNPSFGGASSGSSSSSSSNGI
jgi:hypothetical protein